MTSEQNKIADEAIQKLNQIRSQIAAKQGNVNDLTQRYNDILMEIKGGLHDVLNPMKDAVHDYWANNNKVNIREIPVCGTLQKQPKYNEATKVVGGGVIDTIISDIKENPINYADLIQITEKQQAGRGAGQEVRRIRIPQIGQPKWVQELESDLRLFKQRRKTKVYYDPESLVRGIPAKQKEKKILKSKTLFVLLDTSGSMLWTHSKGHSVLELVASYIVPIAQKFQGELWQVDDGTPSKIIPLKDLTKATVKGIPIQGGGGTNFDEVWRLLKKKKDEITEKIGKEAEFMTILLTDAVVSWNLELMPDNLIIVTLPETQSHLPHLDVNRNQKAILVTPDNK